MYGIAHRFPISLLLNQTEASQAREPIAEARAAIYAPQHLMSISNTNKNIIGMLILRPTVVITLGSKINVSCIDKTRARVRNGEHL